MWRAIRQACNLPLEAPPLDLRSNAPGAYDEAVKKTLIGHIDSLEILAIDQNTDVVMQTSGLWNLRKKLAHPHEAQAPQHEGAASDFLIERYRGNYGSPTESQ